ncbi:TetR/AcrR family transcriptional regulator [Lichenihabitans sp. Uapishka_5]|uniref:TetR/AcrR family transcriptional regulator n=1 Tax=Lichenihabitans sp. Uapishka_5 TaxID=3037302 RepID=UPI0029E7E020|nr:TetR/AcrR family transcriptional regulator [Lichenihabitans sp. Uapishka_5]MDX7950562.1 TetR/AcrR family transcriptional regulator [Lichenihabitans sp. Uapishka_5]
MTEVLDAPRADAGSAARDAGGPKSMTTEKPKRHTGGRPSQEEARRRDERLVEIAARTFMDKGFDATTIDAVAEAASVGKATLYARYRDKPALFAAVFQRKIDLWLAPLSLAATSPASGDVDDVLLSIARAMMASAMAPEALAISRILIAQAPRFPDLARLAHQEGWQRSISALSVVLSQFVADGQLAIADCDLAADLFLSLVIGRQTRLAMLGIETAPAQIDLRIRAAVRLFLDGAKAR